MIYQLILIFIKKWNSFFILYFSSKRRPSMAFVFRVVYCVQFCIIFLSQSLWVKFLNIFESPFIILPETLDEYHFSILCCLFIFVLLLYIRIDGDELHFWIDFNFH